MINHQGQIKQSTASFIQASPHAVSLSVGQQVGIAFGIAAATAAIVVATGAIGSAALPAFETTVEEAIYDTVADEVETHLYESIDHPEWASSHSFDYQRPIQYFNEAHLESNIPLATVPKEIIENTVTAPALYINVTTAL